jgi:hypothetical protein
MQFNSLMTGQQQQQQRQPPPLMNGHPQQQLQQRGPGPFQSPTMAHSPQNNAGTPGQPGPSNQPQQGQQQQGQPPMGQFGGPSPNMAHAHMNRTDMLPPNGAINPMGPGQQQQQLPQQPGGPPTPGYSQQQQQQGGGRPPSRTNTPGGMMHASPSLASRQVPPTGMGGGAVSEINAEVMHIPQNLMTTLKREMGLADKDLATLTTAEKVRFLSLLCLHFTFFYPMDWESIFPESQFFFFNLEMDIADTRFSRSQSRILQTFRSRTGLQQGPRNPNQKPGQQDNNPTAGPSTGIMQAPGQGQPGQRGAPQQAQHPQQRNKRSSTSPGEEVRLTFFTGSITLH